MRMDVVEMVEVTVLRKVVQIVRQEWSKKRGKSTKSPVTSTIAPANFPFVHFASSAF
jgi:hypothetical protein